jgi:hypothetical protein
MMSVGESMMSVGEAARRLGAKPVDITAGFYRGNLRDDLCPIVAGRRLIPESFLPQIESFLKRNGRQVNASLLAR